MVFGHEEGGPACGMRAIRLHHKQYIRLLDVIQADRGGAAPPTAVIQAFSKYERQLERQLRELYDERMQF